MTLAKILPTYMIVLSLGASAVYALSADGDWRRSVYWLAGAVLNAVVTW